ncbi:hypothetical protein L0663_10570 [Dyadobacter sp. CY107]|uniref:hypothetical protein n=1 Tax=Dyadobacter fanqingshengii TaxID=2906443 RepID=UPI001F21C477|nr:hypothetical protein [Dyadobacter fanqingshengii]MCF2503822.1 hypothetical protein [Dyadobacter fanqingshengii]
MNLVQKSPIGLGLACLLMLSNCSKEDVPTPEPGKSQNTSSNMRGVGGGLISLPALSPTNGPTGLNVYPSGWRRSATASNDLFAYPTGTSSCQHLWGDISVPWEKLILKESVSSIATVSTSAKINLLNEASTANKRSAVETTIKFLKPGKKYEVTVHVATTKLFDFFKNAAYANVLALDLVRPTGIVPLSNTLINQSKQAVWVSQTITFEATNEEEILRFTAYTDVDNKLAYAHIYVDENAIKELP